ncbi:MAG TPA: hypothetical protein VGG74_31740 [Kofleriaceae bacterium]
MRNLRTGEDTQIDGGQFGSVSIAPDAKHVAYEGIDEITKYADRSGVVTALPGAGCAGPASWLSSDALVYCVSGGSMLLPALGATPRLISNYGVSVSPDGTEDAFIDGSGDVVLENLDGTDVRVLVPSSDPTETVPHIDVAGFTPDQRALLVLDHSTYPNALEIVALADGTTTAVSNAFFGGPPVGSIRYLGASGYSADGSELLMQSTTSLIAVNVGTGAVRPIAAFSDGQSSAGAVFLDDQQVLWVRVDDMSVGDEGAYQLSVHVAGPGPADDLVLDPPGQTRALLSTIAVSPAGFIALPSDIILMKLDGTVLARNGDDGKGGMLVDDILGLTSDGAGVMTVSWDGDVRNYGQDGTSSQIVTTATNTDGLLAPFSAYATAE